MLAVVKTGLPAVLVALASVVALPQAEAQQVRAYALIKTERGTVLPEGLGDMMNCKALTASLIDSTEVVAHIHCSTPKDLNTTVTGQIPQLDGVLEITVWSVAKVE